MGYAHQVFTNISQTMNGGIQMLSPSSYLTNNPSWLFEESKGSKWTHEENKLFENALAHFDKDTPDRWYNVAAMIPGKTVSDVIKQYRELEDDVSDIEAGLIPVPGYDSSSFTFDWVNNQGFDGSNQFYTCSGGKRTLSARIPDQERKKGVPWTVEEHRQFLMGLKKYGKGDWRNISRNFVTTRTPTQVASHAQKYFIRQLSGGKDKRRSSIHDITTVNVAGNKSFSPEDNTTTSSPDRCSTVTHNVDKALHHWNPTSQGASMAFDLHNNSTLILGNTCGTSSYGYKLQEQSIERGPQFGGYNSNFFQMHPIQYQ